MEVVGPDRFNHEELCELVAEIALDGRYRRLPSRPSCGARVASDGSHAPFPAHVERGGRAGCGTRRLRIACGPGVVVETGTQTIEASGLPGLRRFREARSMNQVHGRRGDDELALHYALVRA